MIQCLHNILDAKPTTTHNPQPPPFTPISAPTAGHSPLPSPILLQRHGSRVHCLSLPSQARHLDLSCPQHALLVSPSPLLPTSLPPHYDDHATGKNNTIQTPSPLLPWVKTTDSSHQQCIAHDLPSPSSPAFRRQPYCWQEQHHPRPPTPPSSSLAYR
ncbi:hypothetical protein BDQ17DRAFT_1430931 [Cyathus striatus]|nr:hypothetical protein BDQ17DRAFT_1430931 [Cyathus striatus]